MRGAVVPATGERTCGCRLVQRPDGTVLRYLCDADQDPSRAVPPPTGRPDEVVARYAIESPDGLALVQQDIRWSYAELHAHACALAELLRRFGVGPGARV